MEATRIALNPTSHLPSQIPSVSLKEMGPSLDLVIRRTSFAAKDLWKASIKKPRV